MDLLRWGACRKGGGGGGGDGGWEDQEDEDAFLDCLLRVGCLLSAILFTFLFFDVARLLLALLPCSLRRARGGAGPAVSQLPHPAGVVRARQASGHRCILGPAL